MTEVPEIRVGGPEDAPAVLRLWRDAGSEPSHTDDLAGIERLLAHDDRALVVAELEGRIVGSVIAGWDGWRGSIYRLAVAPAYRRSGLGRRLLQAAEERLASLGAVRLQAIVVGDNNPAMSFWEQTSWDKQTQRVRYVTG